MSAKLQRWSTRDVTQKHDQRHSEGYNEKFVNHGHAKYWQRYLLSTIKFLQGVEYAGKQRCVAVKLGFKINLCTQLEPN